MSVPYEKNKISVIRRLQSAQGHLKAVEKMITGDAYCLDIVNQNHAVIEALKKINQLILEGELGVCAWDAVNNKDSAKRKKAIQQIVQMYSKTN